MQTRILIVDDELSMRQFLSILLEREGFQTDQAECAEVALNLVDSEFYDLIISDVNMPGLTGIDLLKMVKKVSPETAVLLVTAFSTSEQAVEAMKLGAYDYISKPFKVEEIKVLVRNALEKRDLERENLRLRREITERYAFSGLVGKSKKMRDIYTLIEKLSASMANVLINGESGTGKELAAKAIHYNSSRKDRPFIAVNCGAVPATLMESEFFGHKKGSFTGAIADRPGLFEQANGGTLFLDEIGEVPLLLQAKLLRVLQEREFRRVGDTRDIRVDVRIIAATNRDLEDQVKEGSFREDLFYRINVVQIKMPSLRERPEDIPLLVDHFYKKFVQPPYSGEIISGEALNLLASYHFPGNVRELENIVERCLVLGGKGLSVDCLPRQVRDFHFAAPHGEETDIPSDGMNLEAYLDGIEKNFLLRSLERSGGMKKKAAELLGLTFRSFRYRLAKYGLDEE